MVKRFAAISFITLANIILLAHAVIPHLHNNGLPSLVKLHSVHSHNLQYDAHEHNAEDHEADSNNEAACILKQLVYPPSNSSNRLDCQCTDCSSNYHDFQTILQDSNRFNLGYPLQSTGSVPPILKSFYSVLSSSCSGLRAPPLS